MTDAREGRIDNISAALLVGGASSRMGRDKAHLPVGATTLAAHAARLLASLFEDVLLVGGDPPEDAPGRRVPDRDGPVCALRGLVSALASARCERVIVVATDMPLLSAELILGLVAWSGADAVVPRSADGPHPLCALYRRDPVLAAAERRLDAGELKLQGVLAELDVSWLEGDDLALVDPEGHALSNVNTPEQWSAISSID